MNVKSREIKVNQGDELVVMSCATYEVDFENVCAGYGNRIDNNQNTYEMLMDEAKRMFPQGCDDHGISLDGFIELEKLNGR